MARLGCRQVGGLAGGRELSVGHGDVFERGLRQPIIRSQDATARLLVAKAFQAVSEEANQGQQELIGWEEQPRFRMR